MPNRSEHPPGSPHLRRFASSRQEIAGFDLALQTAVIIYYGDRVVDLDPRIAYRPLLASGLSRPRPHRGALYWPCWPTSHRTKTLRVIEEKC